MQLHPREQFTIVRQLQNPYITDTFYVRAVIRNSKTDTIIETLDLIDNTGQRFSKTWMVPADPSGQGFYISIVTSVYTDSGYTTKSENYGDEENTYLIQDRYVFNPNYPVGADVDYKRIKKMIDEAVARVAAVTPSEPKVVTVTKEVIKEVRIPEVKIVESVKSVNIDPVLSAIKDVGKKIAAIEFPEIPEQKPVDMVPVIRKIEDVESSVMKALSKVDSSLKSISVKSGVKDSLKKIMQQLDVAPEEEYGPDERVTRLMKMK
jgi:hypothetical protein